MGIRDKIADAFIASVNKLTPDINNIYQGAKDYSVGGWKTQQNSLVTASGAAAAAIPVAHLAAITADVAFVLNRMGTSSFGIGAIKGNGTGFGNILEQEDFPLVLGYWANDDETMQAIRGKGAADLSSKVALKVGTKVAGKSFAKGVASVMLTSSGYLVGQKLGGKAMAKAAAKFAGKFAGKVAGGFIPFLGPAVSGGINLWLINSILEAAAEYYDDKIDLIRRM